jgi:hypothetical protein
MVSQAVGGVSVWACLSFVSRTALLAGPFLLTLLCNPLLYPAVCPSRRALPLLLDGRGVALSWAGASPFISGQTVRNLFTALFSIQQ